MKKKAYPRTFLPGKKLLGKPQGNKFFQPWAGQEGRPSMEPFGPRRGRSRSRSAGGIMMKFLKEWLQMSP